MATKTLDGIAVTGTSPLTEENPDVLRARIRQLEEERERDQAVIGRLRRKEFDASLERAVADGLKAATFKASPDGRILAANQHALDLCGPVFEQGGNLFSLIMDRLHAPSGIASEDSAVHAVPQSYSKRLREAIDASMQVTRLDRRARRESEGFETDYSVMEQLIYESFDGPVRVLMAMSYVRDHNAHPWIQLTLVNLDAVNRDDLTGLWRRGTFDNVLVRKVEERKRMYERLGYAPPLALAMYDIDHFKKVNDTYGHQAGDDVLKAVARRVQRVYNRKTDLPCRYGGEELAVVSDSDGEEATANALRGLKSVRGAEIMAQAENGKVAVRCTVSIGLTQFEGPEDTAARMVARADAALYEAKGKKSWGFNRGRNRIVFDGRVLMDPDRKTR